MLRGLIATGVAFILSGCGADADDSTPTDSGLIEVAEPRESGSMEGPTTRPSEPVAAEVAEVAEETEPKCPAEPNVFCRGPILVRVANANLGRDRYRFGAGTAGYVGNVTFVVENNSDGPLRFNVLGRENIGMVLENGTQLRYDGRDTQGIKPCQSDLERCFERQSSDFIDLPLAESPATIQITFSGRTSEMEDRALPRVEEASVNLPVVVETTDGQPIKIDAAFRNVALFNNMAG